MKIYYITLISRSKFVIFCVYFCFLIIAFNAPGMRQKSFIIFTGITFCSLWLSFHNATSHGFFSWIPLIRSVNIWSMIKVKALIFKWWHIHQTVFVELHEIYDMEFRIAHKSWLCTSLVSNVPSATECIWHYPSHWQF